MITTEGQVVAHKDQHLIVQCQPKSVCGSCALKKGCGTGVLSEVLAPNAIEVPVQADIHVPKGARVLLGLPERHLLRFSFSVYLLPILGLFLGAVLMSTLGFGEVWQIAFGFFSAALGYGFAKWRLNIWSKKTELTPVLVKILTKTGSVQTLD